jgi:hypothetical protein
MSRAPARKVYWPQESEGARKKVPHRHFVFSIPKVFEGISSSSSS